MKVLHLLSSTGYHGAENMVAELIHQLSELGVKNYLGVFDNGINSNMDILKVAHPFVQDCVSFPCHGKVNLKTVLLLRKYAKDHAIDILHSHKYKTNVYALLASRLAPWRLVSTCHNWLGRSLNMRLYTLLDKRVLRGFDAVVGVSDEVALELRRHINSHKVRKIENGVDIRKYGRLIDKKDARKNLGLEDKQVIGFVGRLVPDKGISYLLRAIQTPLLGGDDFYTLIVGSGDYDEVLKEEVSSLGIDDKVIFTGNRTDMPSIYASMDIFVLPSLKEAFPMTILEAMACGVPVVATRVGDIPKIIEHNVSGILIDPKDINALSRAIHELLIQPDKAEQIGRTAHETATKSHSSLLMAEKYQALYQQVMNHN